jgi:hypothetical protein
MKRVWAALAIVVSALVACADGSEDVAEAEGAAGAAGDFWGKDRVGALLERSARIPASYLAYEEMFGVGRKCNNPKSNEIFIVEETQTRLAGPRETHDVTPTKLMPRAVITGCNDGSGRQPHTLMAALISDPDQPGADQGDTIRTWPLEVMALDEKTGLYNFYIFEPVNPPADGGPVPIDAPGKVTRVYRTKQRNGSFNVFERKILGAGQAPTAQKQPIGGANRCFNCHVEGAPLMNELRDPWTNWVSFKNKIAHSQMSGLTQELVGKALPAAEKSSLGNDLQPIIESGITEYTFGRTERNGWARKTLAGELPGGIGKMLKSVFCETEVNYGNPSEAFPLEIWLDPDAASSASLVPPSSFGNDLFPFQFPIRSTRDRTVEAWLVQKKFLDQATVKAIRLLDDENDIFSPPRCALLPEVTRGAPTQAEALSKHVRSVVRRKLEEAPFKTLASTQPKRFLYLTALLDERPGQARIKAEEEYNAELTERYEAMEKGETEIKAKERFRKARIREKFRRSSRPLPVLDRPD